MTGSILDELWNFLSYSGRRASIVARRHGLSLVACGLVVLAAFYSWSVYDHFMTREITLYVGPAGSDGWDDARAISDRIQESSTVLAPYQVRLAYSDGFEDNRRLVSQDTNGTHIGFAHDGFGDSSKIAILAPISPSFLHALCSKKFLHDHHLDKPQGIDFAQIAAHSSEHLIGKVFLGLPQSGTRQAASLVLEKYGLDPEKLATNGVEDYNEMRAALANGNIAIAFYSGPRDSALIGAIAKDDKCRLLDLGEVAPAIVQQNRQVSAAEFQPHVYRHGDFCPRNLSTIATQCVVICAEHMSVKDAYFLSSCIVAAMQDRKGTTIWHPENPNATSEKGFTYALHSGAQLVSEQKSPSRWFTGLGVLGSTLALWLATHLLSAFNRRRQGQKPTDGEAGTPAKPMPVVPTSYESVMGDIEQEAQALDAEPDRLSRAVAAQWHARIDALRVRIDAARREKTIDFKEAAILRAGLQNELVDRLALRSGRRAPQGNKAKSASVPKGKVAKPVVK